MAGKIFISYRREDDPGFAQLLFQELKQVCSTEDLFMDVKGHIQPGDDFRAVLTRSVAACDVLLAVIGQRWADLMVKRAGDPNDFVMVEIGAALEQGKRVIPVLVGGATMPQVDILPRPVRELAMRQKVELRPEHFLTDCERFLAALRPFLEAGQRERAARAEDERREREARAKDERSKRATEERWREIIGNAAFFAVIVGLVNSSPIILWATLGSRWGIACIFVEIIVALGLVAPGWRDRAMLRLHLSLGAMICGLLITFVGITIGSTGLMFVGVAVGILLAVGELIYFNSKD